MNGLISTIENMFDDFTIHPSGAYVITHMNDTAFVFPNWDGVGSSVVFGTRAKLSGTHTEIANALRDWRDRPQL